MVTQDIAGILFSHQFNALFWLIVLVLASLGTSKLSTYLDHPGWLRQVLIILVLFAFGVGLFPLMIWVDLLFVNVSDHPGPGGLLYLIGLMASGLAVYLIQSAIDLNKLPGYQSFSLFFALVLVSAFSILLLVHLNS
ncbi:MAG: hypothetical protein AAFV80_17350 [Bacteroidota bacterium]